MKVLLTGATGFTGSHVLELLLDRGISPRCLLRDRRRADDFTSNGLDVAFGDLSDSDSLLSALQGVDILMNIASLGFGHAPGLIAAAERAGVSRAVFISTTAIFTSLNAQSKAVRLAAEQRIEQSRLSYTILRPTMIYGTDRDRNISRLIRFIRRWHTFPVVGTGRHLQQPVYVRDVAGAVIDAALNDQTVRRSYNIPGARSLTFVEMIDVIGQCLATRVRKLFIPVRSAIVALKTAERIGMRLPIRAEQVMRLEEDKAFAFTDAAADFGYAPRTFEEGVRTEIMQMGLLRGDAPSSQRR